MPQISTAARREYCLPIKVELSLTESLRVYYKWNL
jgi:hypothetical protein